MEQDPHSYFIIQVFDERDEYLMDFDCGQDRMKAIEEERELQSLGFATRRLELSTSPLFGQIGEEELDQLVYGQRMAY